MSTPDPSDPLLDRIMAFVESAASSEEWGHALQDLATVFGLVPDDRPQPLMTAEEVSEVFRVDVRTLRRMVHAGEAPEPITIGSRVKRWRAKDIASFINNN